MSSANGKLTSSELAPVGDGLELSNTTATAWLAMVAAAARAGVELWIAKPVGAYRSLAVQQGMRSTPQAYGLNPASVVSVAAPGYSTHGDGTRVDVGSFPPAHDLGRFGDDGRRRRAWLLKNAAYYGFTREFGEADPNHYKHDGRTKAAWLQYRLDWDEMVSKAELEAIVDKRTEAAVERVLSKKLMTSEVSGNAVSVLQVLPKMHLNLFELNERDKARTEAAAAVPPTTS